MCGKSDLDIYGVCVEADTENAVLGISIFLGDNDSFGSGGICCHQQEDAGM